MLKIGITGPESSGKSTLSMELSQALNCSYLPEFARFYLQEQQAEYTLEDLNTIIEGQIEWIKTSLSHSKASYLICDTEFLVLDVWEEVRFGSCSLALYGAKKQRPFDLILLCFPDIPWEEDPLRESNGELDWLFEKYLEKTKASGTQFVVIKGNHRLEQALEFVHKKKDR
ncbi:MAG: nicotinamide riboside kinase [Flavobacteriales bacterium]|jgi:nicotinamide riboside kinase